MLITQYFAKDLYRGKTVFVTGGGSGINLGVAKNFAALGASIAICGRTQGKLDAAAEELRASRRQCLSCGRRRARHRRPGRSLRSQPPRARIHGRADLRRGGLLLGAGGEAVCQRLSRRWSISTCLVPLTPHGPPSSNSRETKGALIYISAGMAYMPHAFQVHVGAAKAWINMMMKNLALEWGHYGIRITSIVPGPIEGTEGLKRLCQRRGKQDTHRCRADAPYGYGRRYRPDRRLSCLAVGLLHLRLRRCL